MAPLRRRTCYSNALRLRNRRSLRLWGAVNPFTAPHSRLSSQSPLASDKPPTRARQTTHARARYGLQSARLWPERPRGRRLACAVPRESSRELALNASTMKKPGERAPCVLPRARGERGYSRCPRAHASHWPHGAGWKAVLIGALEAKSLPVRVPRDPGSPSIPALPQSPHRPRSPKPRRQRGRNQIVRPRPRPRIG